MYKAYGQVMDFKLLCTNVILLVLVIFMDYSDAEMRRCFSCRSRSELGSCKDPFTFNVTQAQEEAGVEVNPCASGWCGKIIETENALKEEYGVATQRMCLQRGPSDGEDRCAYTMWNRKRVYMCFCRGDICNASTRLHARSSTVFTACFGLALLARNLVR